MVAYLEGGCFLPLNSERIDAVDDLNLARFPQLANDVQSFIEITANGDGLCPIHESLSQLAHLSFARAA